MDKQKHDNSPETGLDDGLVKRWAGVPTTIISDMRQHQGILDPGISLQTPDDAPVAFAGRAVVALCPAPDFGAVVHAVDLAGPGDVLVIAAGADRTTAMIGDVLCSHLADKGVIGVICDGMIRDLGDLRRRPSFPVYARGATPNGPTGKTGGQVNSAAELGGVQVQPGDLIVGDEDGVAVLSPAAAAELIDAMEAALSREAGWRKRLAAGDSLCNVLGVDALSAS